MTSNMLAPDSIQKEKSELFQPCDGYTEYDELDTGRYREVTFEDIFREKFTPLDCRKKVGNYAIGKTIGEGSFAKVRHAKHVTTGEKVRYCYNNINITLSAATI